MNDFLVHIGWLTLSMSAIILFVLLFNKIFGGRFSAKSRYVVWTVVILSLGIGLGLYKLPTLFTFQVAIPSFTEESPDSADGLPVDEVTPPAGDTSSVEVPTNPSIPSTDTSPITNPNTNTNPNPTPGSSITLNPSQGEVTQNPGGNQAVTDFNTPDLTTPTEKVYIDPIAVILAAWAVGAVFFFAVSLAAYVRSTHIYAREKRSCDEECEAIYCALCEKYNIRRAPRVYLSKKVGSPILYGYFSPTILLPDIRLSRNSLVGVLAHELTHYRRGDIWIKLLCLVVESLYWFNPLVHIAAARCNAEMELSCDEAVLLGTDADVRRFYGGVMLDIVEHCNHKGSLLTTQYSPQKNAVKERIMNILDMTKKKRGRAIIAAFLVLCIIAGTVIGCTVTGVGKDEETDDPNEVETDGPNEVETEGPDEVETDMPNEGTDQTDSDGTVKIYRCDEMVYPDLAEICGAVMPTFPVDMGDYKVKSIDVILCEDGCDRTDVLSRAMWGYAPGWRIDQYTEYTTDDGWNYTTRAYKNIVPDNIKADMIAQGAPASVYEPREYPYVLTLDETHYAIIVIVPIDEEGERPENEEELVNEIVKTIELQRVTAPYENLSDFLHSMPGSIDELMELDITYMGEETTLGAWVEKTHYYPLKYSIVDLDGDREHEMVFLVAYEAIGDGGHLILHGDGETVYAHMLYYREFNELKADGTFDFSASAFHSGIGRLTFDGEEYTKVEVALRCPDYENDSTFYYLNGNAVTADEYETFNEMHVAKPEVTWYDIEIKRDESENVSGPYFGKGSIDELMELPVISTGNETTLAEWFENSIFSPVKYSVVDLDGDGEQEMVFGVTNGSEVNASLILHAEDGKVYAYFDFYRAGFFLLFDGTFCYVDGISDNGYITFDFDGENRSMNQLARYMARADGELEYYFGDEKVSKAEYDAFVESQRAKPYAVWYDIETGGTVDDGNNSSQQENTPTYIQVEEIPTLPKDPSEAWRVYEPMMAPIYYFFDNGLTYYCRYEYKGVHCEKNTLILPEGYTNGEIFYVRGTGGSASMYIIVKTDQGYLRYYSTTSHYPDEILSVNLLTDDELEYEKSCMENDQMFVPPTTTPTYTVENSDGSVIHLHGGTNKLTAMPSADGLIDFSIPKYIYDEYCGDTGGDFEIAVGGAVLSASVSQYHLEYTSSVELHLNSITYSGRTVTFDLPIALSGNIGIAAFEADGAFVFMKQYYGDGEGYIIKDGAVYEIRNYSSPAFYDVSGVLSLYKGEDGEIMYKRIAEEFNTAAQSDYIILMNLTSRDQYYGEIGTVTVDDGELSFRRAELYTVSDYFEARGTTIDEWFENFDRSDFDKIFTDVSDPADVTLEDVFEHNLSGRDGDRAATAKEHFDAVLAGEEKVYLENGEAEFLALCLSYSGLVCEYPNEIAYVDLDGDGVDELIVKSLGEHILQYDFEDERVYAVFMTPRGSYTYYTTGEIAYIDGDEAPRCVVVKLSKGKIELSEVRYTDTEPDREEPTWTAVELPNPNEN